MPRRPSGTQRAGSISRAPSGAHARAPGWAASWAASSGRRARSPAHGQRIGRDARRRPRASGARSSRSSRGRRARSPTGRPRGARTQRGWAPRTGTSRPGREAAVAGHEVTGVLASGRALEHRLREVARLGRETDDRTDDERVPRRDAGEPGADARRERRNQQPAGHALDGLRGAEVLDEAPPAEPAAGEIRAGVVHPTPQE